MGSNYRRRSMFQRSNNNNDNELGYIRRVQMRQQEMNNLSMHRHRSARTNGEGSSNGARGSPPNGVISSTEERLRSHPAYASYYYRNVHRKPGLPPPLPPPQLPPQPSTLLATLPPNEDRGNAQRLQRGGSSVTNGDRRTFSRNDGGNGSRSLFMSESDRAQHGGVAEWEGNGLIGMPSLELRRQKSAADFVQDDTTYAAGGGRVNSLDKRKGKRPINSLNAVSPGLEQAADNLAAALSGINLSSNNLVDGEQHFLNWTGSRHFDLPSLSQSAKRSNNNGVAMDPNNFLLPADAQTELQKLVVASVNSYLNGPSRAVLNGDGSSFSQYHTFDGPNSSFPHHGFDGYSINSASPPMLGNHLSGGGLPPSYENDVVMEDSGMDSGMTTGFVHGYPGNPASGLGISSRGSSSTQSSSAKSPYKF